MYPILDGDIDNVDRFVVDKFVWWMEKGEKNNKILL